jgi:HK97 family phage prohead protease
MPEIKKDGKGHEIRILTTTTELRIKEGDDGIKKLAGYAARFNRVAEIGWWFDETIKPGAFEESIRTDDIRALFNHDSNLVLGRNRAKTLNLFEDEQGLAFEIVPPDTQTARDLLVSVERGDVSQMSFQFDVIKDEWEYGQDSKEKDLRTLIKVKLYDVSVATFGAYGDDTEVYTRSKDCWEESRKLWEAQQKMRTTSKVENIYYQKYCELL